MNAVREEAGNYTRENSGSVLRLYGVAA